MSGRAYAPKYHSMNSMRTDMLLYYNPKTVLWWGGVTVLDSSVVVGRLSVILQVVSSMSHKYLCVSLLLDDISVHDGQYI